MLGQHMSKQLGFVHLNQFGDGGSGKRADAVMLVVGAVVGLVFRAMGAGGGNMYVILQGLGGEEWTRFLQGVDG
eukprot:5442738-Ditylum_brightwellii.AAC.1